MKIKVGDQIKLQIWSCYTAGIGCFIVKADFKSGSSSCCHNCGQLLFPVVAISEDFILIEIAKNFYKNTNSFLDSRGKHLWGLSGPDLEKYLTPVDKCFVLEVVPKCCELCQKLENKLRELNNL